MKKAVVLFSVIIVLFGQALLAEAWGRHGFRHHFGHHRFFVGTTVFVGPGFWGPPWWDPYWYPPAYQPPVVIQQQPQVYVQQSQPAVASYWYYCADAKAYYPYVQQCPAGWLRVVPQTTPPHQ
jgi:hypothetical protein